MDEQSLEKGQRVQYKDGDGIVRVGVVDSHRKGWVMVNVDEPYETGQGWKASRVMMKTTTVTPIA